MSLKTRRIIRLVICADIVIFCLSLICLLVEFLDKQKSIPMALIIISLMLMLISITAEALNNIITIGKIFVKQFVFKKRYLKILKKRH